MLFDAFLSSSLLHYFFLEEIGVRILNSGHGAHLVARIMANQVFHMQLPVYLVACTTIQWVGLDPHDP